MISIGIKEEGTEEGSKFTVNRRSRHFLDVYVERHNDPDSNDLRAVVHRSVVHECHALFILTKQHNMSSACGHELLSRLKFTCLPSRD